MFGLFKNSMNASQLPSQVREQFGVQAPNLNRTISPKGWDMFSQRNPEMAAQVQPMIPQSMFQQPNPGPQFGSAQNKLPGQGGGEMNAQPFIEPFNARNTGLGLAPTADPFTSYRAAGNGTVQLGRRDRGY